MAYRIAYSDYPGSPTTPEPPAPTPPSDGSGYRLRYSDYSNNETGPPTEWVFVTSFNTRTGAVTLNSADVTTALTYTPYDATNPAGYVTAAGAASAAPVQSFNTRTGAITLTSADVTTALTYTPYNATNPAGYQTAAQVTTAVTAATRNANLAHNSGFAVNQRAYVSGTARASGAFAHDRWKAGAGGCTYTFTQSAGPSTTITITAGTLQQVVEGAALAGGNYMLSWTGTAQGRVGAGSYAASPVTVAGIVAGANTTIEFNAGTLGQVRLEAGAVVTPYQPRTPQEELAEAQRYYQVGQYGIIGYAGNAGNYAGMVNTLRTAMRAAPTIVIGTTVGTDTNVTSAAAADQITATSFRFAFQGTAAGPVLAARNYTASADL